MLYKLINYKNKRKDLGEILGPFLFTHPYSKFTAIVSLQLASLTSDEQNILNIEAIDADGTTVYKQDMNKNVASLNTNNFAAGKYNIIVTTTNGKMSEELVID